MSDEQKILGSYDYAPDIAFIAPCIQCDNEIIFKFGINNCIHCKKEYEIYSRDKVIEREGQVILGKAYDRPTPEELKEINRKNMERYKEVFENLAKR